ncbi:MAG: hypothetical protein RBS72_09530 [Sedimentisphaerales bacterium]|jgi:hypothetical protein|nr:hypothetical protein [Sedimentisphaerales bacterium]NLZ04305.1 hypothetical protein [Phycisphaerae bacterium]HNY77865.1 hypothetical protein [Sedimentisphaerales bacterium]HOC63086.1 hypothetical protein [Sedimentisphaerales bacterium]HOH64040.1 hypothetical protein [Sedimentisphaerales bacterium]
MNRQLRVRKSDGSTEAYLHTKVLGTINNAMTACGQGDMVMAEDLTEVVTFYLYNKHDRAVASSGEIFAMIKAVLTATGNEEAALALTKHAFERRLRRLRTEVLAVDIHEFTDAEQLFGAGRAPERAAWDKGRIVQDLTERFGMPRRTARAVASGVEEKVFRMEITMVPLSLIKQLVLGEAAALLHAERELQVR